MIRVKAKLNGGGFMEYKLYVKDLELTPALEDYISKRMTKLDKHLKKHSDLISPADFRISKEGGKYKVDITSHFKKINKIIKVEERSGDLYEGIDNVTDSMERKIRKLKNKLQEHFGSEPEISADNFYDKINETEDQKIMKEKRYDLSIMSRDEAILQAELLGHNFYVFRNSETDEVNVIYKRKNNSLGVIEFND